MALTFQGDQYLTAGHILQPAVGLDPVPPLAEYPGNPGAADMPMFIDDILDGRNIFFGNGAISDGYGQHDDCISERIRGRQQKMQANGKYFSRRYCRQKSGRRDSLRCHPRGLKRKNVG